MDKNRYVWGCLSSTASLQLSEYILFFILSNKSSLPLQLSPQAAVKTSLFSLNTNESVTHQSVLTQHGLCTVLLLCWCWWSACVYVFMFLIVAYVWWSAARECKVWLSQPFVLFHLFLVSCQRRWESSDRINDQFWLSLSWLVLLLPAILVHFLGWR